MVIASPLPISNDNICSFRVNILERKIPNLFLLNLIILNLHGPISRIVDFRKISRNNSSSRSSSSSHSCYTTKEICNLCQLQKNVASVDHWGNWGRELKIYAGPAVFCFPSDLQVCGPQHWPCHPSGTGTAASTSQPWGRRRRAGCHLNKGRLYGAVRLAVPTETQAFWHGACDMLEDELAVSVCQDDGGSQTPRPLPHQVSLPTFLQGLHQLNSWLNPNTLLNVTTKVITKMGLNPA